MMTIVLTDFEMAFILRLVYVLFSKLHLDLTLLEHFISKLLKQEEDRSTNLKENEITADQDKFMTTRTRHNQ